jgi:hypothetical protein
MTPISNRTKSLGIATACAAAVTILMALCTGVSHLADQAQDSGNATDSVQVQVQTKTGALHRVVENQFAHATVVEHGEFRVVAMRGGEALWEERLPNALTYVGQQKILKCFFQATACPAASAQHIGLATTTPTQASTLAGVAELAGVGYERLNAASWTCSSNAATNNYCATATLTFTAGSAWSTVTGMFVADASSGSSGTLLSYAAFSQSRTLANGDSLLVTYTLTLQ